MCSTFFVPESLYWWAHVCAQRKMDTRQVWQYILSPGRATLAWYGLSIRRPWKVHYCKLSILQELTRYFSSDRLHSLTTLVQYTWWICDFMLTTTLSTLSDARTCDPDVSGLGLIFTGFLYSSFISHVVQTMTGLWTWLWTACRLDDIQWRCNMDLKSSSLVPRQHFMKKKSILNALLDNQCMQLSVEKETPKSTI